MEEIICFVMSESRGGNPEDYRGEARSRVASGRYDDPYWREELMGNLAYDIVSFTKKMGVKSFCSRYDHIQQWSYYADSHEGVCIVFDGEALNAWITLHEVEYRRAMPTISDVLERGYDKIHELILLRKSDEWDREEEWRCVIDPSNCKNNPAESLDGRLWPIPDGVIKAVIAGYSISSRDYAALKKICSDAGIKLLKARKQTGEYALNFVECPAGFE